MVKWRSGKEAEWWGDRAEWWGDRALVEERARALDTTTLHVRHNTRTRIRARARARALTRARAHARARPPPAPTLHVPGYAHPLWFNERFV